MAGYGAEREFGRSRIEERLNQRVSGPRAHRIPHQEYQIPEHSAAYLEFRGYEELQHTLHVHQTKLSFQEAQELADIFKPGYYVTAIHGCKPEIDENGNPGSFILLKRKDSTPPLVSEIQDRARPPIPPSPKLRLIDQLPPAETLTPAIIGKRLFEAFKGYDQYGQPSDQLSYLLRHYLISGTGDGNPDYELPSSGTGEPVRPWEKYHARFYSSDPATTEKYTPDSPHITPPSLHYAREIITLTHAHHFFRNRQVEQHDMVFTRDDNVIIPFSYIKGEQPIEPHLVRNLEDLEEVLSDPLWNYSETMIQLWKLPPEMVTYHLQATLKTHEISLRDLIHVLGTPSYHLEAGEPYWE
ncbi:MAG: hypothetical protein NT149_03020 [Candidatus Gottesmanbacteria bacterium]|nr:hypothetical protein [Candidatus Gottesmanbacteria bacterium]